MSVCELPVLFFFFQAEDGIRDGHVTGVQTCALPISAEPGAEVRAALADLRTLVTDDAERTWLERAVGSDAAAWEAEVGQEHDHTGLRAEANIFRYRPVPVLVRTVPGVAPVELVRVLRAALAAGTPVRVSLDAVPSAAL